MQDRSLTRQVGVIGKFEITMRLLLNRKQCALSSRISTTVVLLSVCFSALSSMAQNTPLISGGMGFFTDTNGGNTSYQTIAVPVLEAPIGRHLQVESRGNILESFSPKGGVQGYQTSAFLGLSYLQADYIATSHLTVVGGYFLIPFGTYNERLTPIWISNFQDAPLIFGIGTMQGTSTGGMLRGNAYSTDKISVSYAAYFSAGSSNKEFSSSRSTGGQASVYFPKARLEVGTSYGRLLEKQQANSYGAHVWWEPSSIPLKIRSEYAHGQHSQGYWVEALYRLSQFHGPDSIVGRFEPVFRMQQTFRNSPDPTDGLPAADTQKADFGLNYRLPHEVRVNTSYQRQFSSTGNLNIWETGVVYRFLFPAWMGKR